MVNYHSVVEKTDHISVCSSGDELPTFYAAVVQDTAIPGDLATDTGIALANMTLAAWDKGVGSCIMGAIDKPALTALLGIEEPQKLHPGDPTPKLKHPRIQLCSHEYHSYNISS